jgi:hypothetical protein
MGFEPIEHPDRKMSSNGQGVGSIVLAKDWDSNEVTLCFDMQKSDDLKTWIPFAGGTWTAVANGGVKLTLPLNEAKKLLRVTLKG